MAQGSGIPSKTAVDGTSVTKNQNDEIQVSRPSLEIIGDFEVDLGNWSHQVYSGSGSTSIISSSTRGNNSVNLSGTAGAGNQNEKVGFIERTMDLTAYDTLKVDVVENPGQFFWNAVFIGGNLVQSGNLSDSTLEISLDSYSGDTKISLGVVFDRDGVSSGETYQNCAYDNVQLIKNQKTVINGAGN